MPLKYVLPIEIDIFLSNIHITFMIHQYPHCLENKMIKSIWMPHITFCSNIWSSAVSYEIQFNANEYRAANYSWVSIFYCCVTAHRPLSIMKGIHPKTDAWNKTSILGSVAIWGTCSASNLHENEHIRKCTALRLYQQLCVKHCISQIARIMGPTWDSPGSCRPHVGPMNLAIKVYISQKQIQSWC